MTHPAALPADEDRRRLLACLGGPWPAGGPLAACREHRTAADGYDLERVAFSAEPGDRVPAWALVPSGLQPGQRRPAVLLLHQHNNEWHLGKSEPAGLAGDPRQHVGPRLARRGFVVLCCDALGFEDRQDAQLAGDAYERFRFLQYVVAGKCLAWKCILDIRRAVDYLVSRPDVLPDRVGCFGHSMGATHAWLAGPWEPRLACVVANCCLPTYDAMARTKLVHCFANFVPGWRQWGDTPEIAALVAPRPLLMNFGAYDAGSPLPEVESGIARIAAAYAAAGNAARFSATIEPTAGHEITPAMWQRTEAWLQRWLGA